LLDDLPLEPFLEVSPDFSRYFLPSLAILSIVRLDHVPSSAAVCYRCSYPIEHFPKPVAKGTEIPVRVRPLPYSQLPRRGLLGNSKPLVSEYTNFSILLA
jgi:hypothetical protein